MTKNILMIEDDGDLRLLIKRCLKKDAHEVHEAWSGEEGLEKLSALKPDLVILDLGLPGMNGIQVCQKIRATPESASVPVIVLTSEDKHSVMEECKAAGANEFITKPVDIHQIRDVVNKRLK